MLKILAFAKINLYLRVTSKLPDGYHTLETVMQTVTLSDQLQIVPNHSGDIVFTCNVPALEKRSNLVLKACDLFFQATGLSGGFTIHLDKRIPIAAGLGGGSSDAAATLAALNHLYNAPLKISELERISLRLGADVPFFIRGGCALARSKGEELTPLEKTTQYFYVLVKAGEKTSTGEMYAALDRLHSAPDIQPAAFERMANDIEYLYCLTQNDFTAVSPLQPAVLSDFIAAGAEQVLLSGSGPTCFSVFNDRVSANTVYEQMKRKYPCCFLAADAPSGSLLV